MKKNNCFNAYQFLFMLFAFLGMRTSTYATHAVGADLTYTCISANTYEVTLRFYRDCGGVAAPSNPSISIVGSSGCTSVTSSVALTLISTQEVSQVCAGTQTSCAGGNVQGTQEVVYRGQVQLPAGCDSYTISFTECDRNSSITNINSNGACIYIETVINTNLAPCNNSPQFNNLPVLYSCQGQLSQFNHGFYDVDGDSLSFSLINPKTTGGIDIPFVNGLTATNPLELQAGTTFQFNSSNGQMTFTSLANTGQVAVISVRIEEYRNGVKIGSMIRDLQMIISATCTSVPPVSGTITPSSGTVTGNLIASCGGPPLIVDFSVSDPDVSDVLTATSDISTVIAGATTSVTGTNPINIRLVIPTASAASGNYPFTITVNDGSCPNPNVQIIGYSLQITNPSPTVTINASATTICEGDPVTLTAQGANSYSWDNSVMNGTAFSPTTSGTYTVIGTATNGCTDTTSVTVTVDPSPNVQINASATSICVGDAVTLSGTGATTYNWNNGVVDGAAFTPTTTNTYTVVGTANNGCTDTEQITIDVNSLPTVIANATGTVICQGETVTLTGSGAISYSWDNGVTNGVAFTPTGNTTYTVIGTDANGCENTDQITVNFVNTAPPTATISAASNQICQGTTTLLTGVVDAANGETIAWYYNGTIIGGANSATYSASQAGSYYNIVTNSSGCTTESATENITFYPQPQAAFSTSAANFCGGTGTITITANTIAGASYAWLNNGALIGGQTQPTLSVSSPGSYQLVVTSADGCLDTSSIFAPINANFPQITVTAPANSYCVGSNLTLTANLEVGATYTWLLNGNSITSPILENNSIAINNSGTYTVEVTNSDGCTAVSNSFVVTENPLPTATISSTATSFCTGSSINLSANFIAGASYEWFLNGNSLGTPTVEDTSWSATSGGNYTVVINDGCSNTSNVINLTTLSAPAAAGNISGSDDLCYGERERYSINNVNGATYYSWSITPANAASISVGQGTNSVTVNSTNVDFQLSVVPVNVCGAGATATQNINLNNGFTCSDVAFAANQTSICEGDVVVFTNYSNSNIGFGLTQQWDFGAGASPATATGSGPHTVTYATSGLKDVTLEYVGQFGTAYYSETYTDYIRVTALASCGVAVIPVKNMENLRLYPNPTTENVVLDLGRIAADIRVDLMTVHGLLLTSKTINHEQYLDLSLKEQPSGLYLISVQIDGVQTVLKVVKE
ncbi:T9SS type A sorting domain-containing protein [Aureispira anguillae]|uniref:T9SS type A sorting domain-containing protein n=1 Tax=Aureispira anguillae TaxID=2864201 RepID=A0A915YJG5_9BACT|nr:T9SS type A sorting domain-containing protein [Aureispira anguillae]BDS14327.1 T9SS type A sorting domain-containing protein [Aureispira anguillae]